MITIVASDDDLPVIGIRELVAAGVRDLVGFQASEGLWHTTRVKNARWLNVARLVIVTETVFGPMTEAREQLDRIREDAWCQITVGWDDI